MQADSGLVRFVRFEGVRGCTELRGVRMRSLGEQREERTGASGFDQTKTSSLRKQHKAKLC